MENNRHTTMRAFKKTNVARALAIAFGGLAIATQFAMAQDVTLKPVTITGSSIKRIAAEGALPVQTISREDIVRSGATSVPELMQQLPTMQGFTTSGESVGGGLREKLRRSEVVSRGGRTQLQRL